MAARKKDIVEALNFVQRNEGVADFSFSTVDSKGLNLSIFYKLLSDDYIRVDGKATSEVTNYTNLRITIQGIMLHDELEKEAYKNSLKGIILPKVDKFLWLIVGWLLAVLSQLIK